MKVKNALAAVYLNARQVEEQYRVTRSRLLTLVATDVVTVYQEPGFMPRYSAADIEAHLASDPAKRPRVTHPNGTRAVPKKHPSPRPDLRKPRTKAMA